MNDEGGTDEDEDDVADPDYIPISQTMDAAGPSDEGASAKRKCVRPSVKVLEDEEDDDDDDDDQPAPQTKKSARKRKSEAGPTTWTKIDLNSTVLPEYQHSPPDFIETPFQYFSRYFSSEYIKHIVYQTNLYATQKDVNTSFTTKEDEIMKFVALLIYMGITDLPSVDDYWAMETRVPQVANLLSSNRFRLLKRMVHFNDNSLIPGTIDRFFKIRPLFSFLNTAFRTKTQTPKQSVDEVMIAYKGKRAGNLRQYIKNKPDKWGFKPGLLKMASSTTWCSTRGRLHWRPMASP
ncbi:PiggyBac transposable element-derived protein 2 [Chionoecetes opilio]|uniref:PiggyBac transposable element-derived protein 2 n=1 Tax=Chionoecetes opilio TaxID=41210 RepID=A0A8J5D5E8_CHIOP|nr:PiggyBac transposable element-derived protein 2 [Chionoecetes opilio]